MTYELDAENWTTCCPMCGKRLEEWKLCESCTESRPTVTVSPAPNTLEGVADALRRHHADDHNGLLYDLGTLRRRWSSIARRGTHGAFHQVQAARGIRRCWICAGLTANEVVDHVRPMSHPEA